MKKSISVIAVLSVCLIAGIFLLRSNTCSNPGNTRESRNRITIAQFGDVYIYAPLYIAADEGFFRNNGIDINIVSTGGDEKTWAAVLSGDAQFGVADPTFIAIAAQRGQEGRIVGTILNGVPFWGVAKNPKVPAIKDPSLLRGFSVATFPSPSTAFALQKEMFERGGVPPSIREAAYGTLLAVVESGNADIALELEPNVSQALENGYRIVYSLADVYGTFALTGITARPDFIEGNPKIIESMITALDQSLEFINNNPDKAALALARRFPDVKADVASRALKRLIAEGVIPRSSKVSSGAWKNALKLRVKAGDLKPVDQPDHFILNSNKEN